MVVTPHSYKSWDKVSFSGFEGECSVLDTPGACNPQLELTGSVCVGGVLHPHFLASHSSLETVEVTLPLVLWRELEV